MKRSNINLSSQPARRRLRERRKAAFDHVERHLAWYDDHGTPEAHERWKKRMWGMV